MGPLTAMTCPSSEPVSTMVPTPLFSVILDRMSSPQIAEHAAGVGQRGKGGLARRGGRRGGEVHNVRELLLQLQIVQNEAVAVVGYAEAVRGLAVGGSSEVGADPGGQEGPRAATPSSESHTQYK